MHGVAWKNKSSHVKWTTGGLGREREIEREREREGGRREREREREIWYGQTDG
jgi:hypothetical protein